MSSSEPSPALRRRWVCPPLEGAAILAAVAMLAACTPALRRFDLVDQPVGCAEATPLAYRTVTALRYRVTGLEPATATQRGVITASRTDTDGEERLTVTLACTAGGVTLDATRDGLLVQQSETRQAFYNTFLAVRVNAATEAEAARQQRAGRAAAAQQRGDLQVTVTPLPGPASRLEFPVDLATAGLLPVRVEITNLTPRTYAVDPAAAHLTGTDRRRTAPLPPADAAARLSSGPGSLAALQDAVISRALTAAEIPPGGQRRGFLYFPDGDYAAATVVITDVESAEPEGVRVEF